MITSQTSYFGPNGKPTPKGLEVFNGIEGRVSAVETLTSVGFTRAGAEALVIAPSITRIIVDGLLFVADVNGEALTTGDGRTWAPDGLAEIGHFGAVDGADSTTAFNAMKDYCTRTGRPVFLGSGGEYLVDPLTVTGSERMLFFADAYNKPEIKLKPGPNGHLIATSGNAVLDLYGVCLDHNRGTRSAGHAIRSGGAELIRLDQVRIQNCQEYAIGYQGGTTKRTEIGFIEGDTTGRDFIDVKDYDNANGPFTYRHIKCSNFALDDADGVGLDIRGPAYGTLLEADVAGSARAFRYRKGGSQGRAGYGLQQSILVTGEGATGGNTWAVDWATEDPRAEVGSIHTSGVGGLILQKSTAVGGRIASAVGLNVYLSDAISLSGTGLEISSGRITKDAAATGVTSFVDFEPTALRNALKNYWVEDPSGAANPVRIQTGATDNVLDLVTVVSSGISDDGIGDSGTNTLIRDPRSYAA